MIVVYLNSWWLCQPSRGSTWWPLSTDITRRWICRARPFSWSVGSSSSESLSMEDWTFSASWMENPRHHHRYTRSRDAYGLALIIMIESPDFEVIVSWWWQPWVSSFVPLIWYPLVHYYKNCTVFRLENNQVTFFFLSSTPSANAESQSPNHCDLQVSKMSRSNTEEANLQKIDSKCFYFLSAPLLMCRWIVPLQGIFSMYYKKCSNGF